MSRTEQKQELFKTIWDIANDLRGSVDGWEFKQYILGFLFYRFISENLAEYINKTEEEASGEPFSYADMSDEDAEYGREDTVKEKGFFILPSQLSCQDLMTIGYCSPHLESKFRSSVSAASLLTA